MILTTPSVAYGRRSAFVFLGPRLTGSRTPDTPPAMLGARRVRQSARRAIAVAPANVTTQKSSVTSTETGSAGTFPMLAGAPR